MVYGFGEMANARSADARASAALSEHGVMHTQAEQRRPELRIEISGLLVHGLERPLRAQVLPARWPGTNAESGSTDCLRAPARLRASPPRGALTPGGRNSNTSCARAREQNHRQRRRETCAPLRGNPVCRMWPTRLTSHALRPDPAPTPMPARQARAHAARDSSASPNVIDAR